MPPNAQHLTVVRICDACEALRHWLLINNHTALQFSLTGAIDPGHTHSAHQAMTTYARALPHTCRGDL